MGDPLEKIYLNPTNEASFGGVNSLSRVSKLKRKDVLEWLKGQKAYSLHRSIRRNFRRNRVIVAKKMDSQWQSDLVDISSLKNFNDGYRYLLTCIDLLSKYAWLIPLMQKSGLLIKSSL